MKTLLKMNNALKQIQNAKSPEDFKRLKERVFNLKAKLNEEQVLERKKIEKQKKELIRQSEARKTSLKGKITVLKNAKKSFMKKKAGWPEIRRV